MTDSYLPTTDGVVTAVLTTRRALEALGHEVFIIAPDPGPEYREEGVYYFKAAKLRTYKGYYVPLFPSNKSEILHKINPDIIHVRGVAFMAEKALIASWNLNIPVVITYDTAVTEVIDQYSPIKLPKKSLVKMARRYLRSILGRATAVIAPTESIRKEILNQLGAVPKKMVVIPTGIDTGKFTRSIDGLNIRKKYGIADKRVVITVGRLSKEKNVDLLIDSIKLLSEDIVLMIVGSGPNEAELKQKVADEGLSERVIFTGYLFGQELVNHYSCADTFASASTFETQGLTVIEAMSCGLPVACANGRAFKDFIKDGVNGFLFDTNVESCGRAIISALSATSELLEKSRETANSFDLHKTTERLVEFYQEVIDKKKQGETKVAIVTDSYHPHMDGVIACVDVMEEVLNKDGYSAEIIAPDSGKRWARRPNVHYCKSVNLPTYEGYYVPVYPSHLKKVLRQMGADVMHAQGYTLMTLKGVIAAHQLGIPVICTFHTLGGDAMQYYSPVKIPKNLGIKLSWIYFRQLAKWIDIIVTPSPDTARELKENGITNEIRSIPTPIDTNRFKPGDGSKIRARLHLENKRVMVHVGRVSFEKEICRLVEVLPRLDEDIVLLIVGKGPAMEDLKAQSKELGVEDRTIFAGFVPDEELVDYYRAGDIGVMSSRWETECLTVLQALACGLPVACADARALRDYMVDGYNGRLFGDSPDEIVSAINKCFSDGDSLKENAIKTLEDYSYSAYEEKLHKLYQDAISKYDSKKE